MTASLILPLNRVSTDASLASSLGDIVEVEGGKAYRLVKAAANISAAARKVLVTAYTAGVPTWNVNTTTTANSGDVVGVVPSDIVTISSTASQIDSGSYFWVQIAGPTSVLSNTTTIVKGEALATSTAAGRVAEIGTAITARVALPAFIGLATSTAAATAAGNAIPALLRRIL